MDKTAELNSRKYEFEIPDIMERILQGQTLSSVCGNLAMKAHGGEVLISRRCARYIIDNLRKAAR